MRISDWSSDVCSSDLRFADDSHVLRIVASLVIVIFFAIYSASGLVAGGKLFETAFGFSYQTGLWVTASVVVAFVVLGGFLAVSLTDFVQGTIMMIALVALPEIGRASGRERGCQYV